MKFYAKKNIYIIKSCNYYKSNLNKFFVLNKNDPHMPRQHLFNSTKQK